MVGLGCSWLVLVGLGFSWLVLVLVLIGLDWSWLVLAGLGWSWLVLVLVGFGGNNLGNMGSGGYNLVSLVWDKAVITLFR